MNIISFYSWGIVFYDIWYGYLGVILNSLFIKRIYDITGKKSILFYVLNIFISVILWILLLLMYMAIIMPQIRLTLIIFMLSLLILSTILTAIPGKLIKKKEYPEEFEGLIDKILRMFNFYKCLF